MDQRASATVGQRGFHPPESGDVAEDDRGRAERIEAAPRARAIRRIGDGVGRPIVSRTPVVEWSGCGDAYRVPGVAVPRPVAAAPCSRASCTWTNARSAAEAAVSPAAVPAAGRRLSSAVARCSRARCIQC